MEPVTQEDLSSVINLVKDPVLLALQLPGFEDERIAIVNWERDSKNDRYEFARVVARVWVHKKKEKATWENLIKALRSESVDESVLAQEVQDRFVLRRGSTTSTRSSLASSFTSSFTGSVFGSSGNADSLTLADAELVSHTKDCNKTRIMRQFSMLTTKIAKQLQSLNVSVKEARDHMDPLIDRSQNFYSRTSRCRRFNDLFRLMSGTPKYEPLWTYDHYSLVKDLVTLVDVDKDSKDEMKSLVQDYISDLNGYRVTKKLASILPYHLSQEYPELVHSGEYEQDFCKDLGKKLECRIRITNESLQYVANLWSDIQKEFTIPSLTALLYQITRGSVIITWLIQPSWACCILREILTSVPFFQDHLIMKVVLDEECIYDEQSGIADNQVICSLWLKEASLSGRIAKFQEAFSQPAVNINSTITNDGATALTIASQCGHVELVEFLLSNGADTTTQLINGQTALHLAASEGFTDVASLLHRKNSELMGILDDNDYSALMEAAAHDHVDVIRVLVSQQDDLGDTEIPTLNEAFHLALMKGHADSVEILQKRGATTLNTAEEGGNPLVVAAGAGHKDVPDEVKSKEDISDEPVKSTPSAKKQSTGILSKFVRKIKEKSLFKKKTISDKLLAECRSETADIEVVRGYLEQEDCDANIRDVDRQWSPLMWALDKKHFEITKLLLKYHPQVHIQDKKEWSPLVLASRAGDLEIVQGIVALGAEIDLPTNRKWTPLMWAAQEGHAEVARFLLEKGAFVDFPDENGWTPVMQASRGGHVDVINILLDHNAKVNHQTETTWCALMAAAKKKHSDAVDTLLERGAQVDIQRYDGSTTLHVASYYKGNSAVMKTLFKHGANVDHLNKDGMTALMLATNKGHLGVVQDLIQGGADTNKQHPETGWTPIFFAAKSGKIDIFKELLYNGARTEIEGRNVVDVASMFKRGKMLSELKTFEQAPHRIISSSVNPPSLEADEPTPVEQEPSITEPKVEISPEEVTKPEQKLAEDSTEEVIIEPPQLPDPEAVKPSLSTTEAKKKEVPTVETVVQAIAKEKEVAAVETVAEQVTKEMSQLSIKTMKEQIKKSSEAKKDIKRQAEIIDLLLKGFDQRMANPRSNMYQYKQTNIADVIGGRKGVKSSEEITHKLKAPEITEPLSGSITTTTTTTQSGFIRVDAADELYII